MTKNRGRRYGGLVRYLKSEKHGWQMRTDELLEKMGLQGRRPIPKSLEMDGLVIGADHNPVHIRIEKSSGRMGRRVFAECPECDQWVCAGHLHQHVQACHPETDRPRNYREAMAVEFGPPSGQEV